jgi:predicted ferric reductase
VNKARWDSVFIERQVEIHSKNNLKKIWVCGPPAMNETFDRTLGNIAGKYKLHRNQIEIL